MINGHVSKRRRGLAARTRTPQVQRTQPLADIKAVQTLLTHHVENGDLEHLKTDAESTYRFEDTNFVYSPGRITWKYDDCNDVIAARENLKELEDTARAVGTAQRKQGTPFWTVR